jgi:error-prone DNA polymerase
MTLTMTRIDRRPTPVPAYAELQVTTNYTFLAGGSHPHEIVAQAKALGLSALAVTDRNTLAGVVRAHVAAKEVGLQLLVGARLDLLDAPSLLCLPTDRAAYGRLSKLLSLGQRRAGKGQCTLHLADVAAHAEGQILIVVPPDTWHWREALAPDIPDRPDETHDADPQPETSAGTRCSTDVLVFPSPSSSKKGEGVGQASPTARAGTPCAQAHTPDSPRVRSTQSNEWRSTQPVMVHTNRPDTPPRAPFTTHLARIRSALAPTAHALCLAASHTYRGDDRARIAALDRLARAHDLRLVATGDVLYHAPHRRPLQDVLTAVRMGTTVAAAGYALEQNGERHIKSPRAMARLFHGHEHALAATRDIADACRFSLDELVYEYPDEPVPAGRTPQSYLEELTWEGARWRFPEGIPERITTTLRRELDLIRTLNYAPYFLTVHDIVTFARSRSILCQGRGSAANSAVCYAIGITAVNPAEVDLLFERFISTERKEPPDIDVDFEHARREEVIQYIYARYGRDRAGLAATVISYRARSAVRDVGKAMGLSPDTVASLAGMVWGTRSGDALPETHVREAGLDPADPLLALVLDLTGTLIGFPRHLSQHVGGFVLTRGPLDTVVPIGNAAMEERTVIEWDKDDIAALGLLKIDVLALGMLTCIHGAFDLIEAHHGRRLTLANVPREDLEVYDMLCRADSLGVFQVESRAQMNMLPRLKPRTFYDLVIEVAIVRPGPIQGDMVHPYLRRRDGLEPEHYPAPAPEHGPADELRQILGKTRGVPLFQEQAMRIALIAARFSDAEVNELRKAMATFRRVGTIGKLETKMISAMVAGGYDPDFAARCFNQIKGFGEYGFPESHAASFAHLVYVSSWLKCHYPAAFAAALLNAQPMGFYAPAQIVRDAREHGVEAHPADVNVSDWDATLEEAPLRGAESYSPNETGGGSLHERGLTPAPRPGGHLPAPSPFETSKKGGGVGARPRLRSKQCSETRSEQASEPRGRQTTSPAHLPAILARGRAGPALRIGLRQVDGLQEAEIAKLIAARTTGGPFRDVRDLWQRAGVKRSTLDKLAAADALRSLGLDRRQALWEVSALPRTEPLPLFQWSDARETGEEPAVTLPAMPESEHVVIDYQTLRLSLKAHPLSFLRADLTADRIRACQDLRALADGTWLTVAGVVLVRQRPGSAKGVVFMTIEDETGIANAVIWPKTLERFRKVVMAARLVVIHGRIQRHEDIIHVVAQRLEDRSDWLLRLTEDGATLLKPAIAKADEVLRPDPGSARSPTHPRWAGHPRNERIIPKSRDFH